MSRLKTSSKAYETAFRRIASVKSIDSAFDLGNNLTAINYQKAIDDVKSTMDSYNTTLSTVDDLLNKLRDFEKKLNDWNERILVGVAAKYGKDSSEYEQAGGTKKSDRKKPTARKKTA